MNKKVYMWKQIFVNFSCEMLSVVAMERPYIWVSMSNVIFWAINLQSALRIVIKAIHDVVRKIEELLSISVIKD